MLTMTVILYLDVEKRVRTKEAERRSSITGDHSKYLVGPTVYTKNLYISLFLLTIFGPIYCGPPQ